MTNVLRLALLATLLVVAGACSSDSSTATPAATTTTLPSATPPATKSPTATAVPQSRPWGEFAVEPVGVPDDPVSPAPQFGASAITSGHLTGATASRDVATKVPRFVDIPSDTQTSLAAKGLAVVFAEATFDPATGAFLSGLLYGRSEQPTAMLQLVAYTPARPPQITDYGIGASGVTVMTLNYAVNGNPTITVFPDPISAAPTNSRNVDWSQGGVVYFLQTTGPFTDDEVVAIARAISSAEAARH